MDISKEERGEERKEGIEERRKNKVGERKGGENKVQKRK